MPVNPEDFSWSPDVFAQWYNAIKFNGDVGPARHDLERNLQHLVAVPRRNDKSRAALAAADSGAPVTLHNGQQFTLNKAFVAAASQLSSELDLDELSAAELLQEAAASKLAQGADLLTSGYLAFFRRYTYIVNILGYYVTENKVDGLFPGSSAQRLLQSLLDGFAQIYRLGALQNDLIDKQKATADINSLSFVNRASYVRAQLFDTHDLLAQCLYSLVDVAGAALDAADAYNKITAHINEHIKDDADSLLLHYLPAVIRLTACSPDSPDADMAKFHSAFTSALSADYAKVSAGDEIDLSKTSLRPYSTLVQLFFFVSFIPWCKGSPARTKKYDFEKDILKYVEWLVNYGALEQALCYTAETANPKTTAAFEQNKLFDLRPLLQKSFPVLKPTKFIYPGNDQLLHVLRTNTGYPNLVKLCDYSNLKVSTAISEDLIAPFFHTFFFSFITHAAIVLTSLRDSEEDFLLSSINKKSLDSESEASKQGSSYDAKDFQSIRKSLSEHSSSGGDGESSLDLDEIATRAELERFYLAFAYTYTNRPQLCEAFWASEGSNIAGFLSWGLANNTSPLITSTFCVLMGSLTYGGSQCSRRIWDTLIQSSDGIYKRNDYSKISIDSIISSLTYYIDALTENLESDLSSRAKKAQEKQEFMFSSGKTASVPPKPMCIQLSEDSVVFIAGFLNLISSVVENANTNEVKQAAFVRFHPIINSLLKFDNLITSAKVLQSDRKFSTVVFNDENRTTIINLIMNLLANFAKGETDLDLRCKIWSVVDRWICHSLADNEAANTSSTEPTRYTGVSLVSPSSNKSEITKLKAIHRGITMKHGFQIAFTNVSEVLNFSRLLENLLEKPELPTSGFESLSLLYPSDLGSSYRYKNEIGIWPYLEFLTVELFAKSTELKEKSIKLELQRSILATIQNSLKSVDWNLFDETAPKILHDFNKVKDNFAHALLSSGEETILPYSSFVRLHHSLAVINFMFDQKVSDALFQIVNYGVDEIFENHDLEELVTASVDCLHQVLYLQNTFIKNLLPLLTREGDLPHTSQNSNVGYGTNMSLLLATPKAEYDKVYYPSNIGTKGVVDFNEILLFHITSVANIAMYAGSSNISLALSSVGILGQMSQSTTFVSKNISNRAFLQPNRLLSILESVDESERIKYSFVNQMESITESLEPKYRILQFILDSLPESNEVTVAHFLLGFNIKANILTLNDKSRYALLLETLVSLLLSTMKLISETEFEAYSFNIENEPMRLASMIMDVLIRLCRNQNSSRVCLAYLRQFGLFESVLQFSPRLDAMTTWNGLKFEGELSQSTNNRFLGDLKARETFFFFISFGNSVLQYLSCELHESKSPSQKEFYIKSLLDGSEFLDGTPKVLGFLDVLNFQFVNFEDHKVSDFESKYNLPVLLSYMRKEEFPSREDRDIVKELTLFKCEVANVNLPDDASKRDYMNNAVNESRSLENLMQKYIAFCDLKALHSKTLHSWVQIIQVLANDVSSKIDFISQVMQMILPKINNEYYDRDILFAEELISLCVYLFELYEDEISVVNQGGNKQHYLHGVLSLFKTCINGLLCSNSTTGLRADLYLLLNKFIQRSLTSKDLLPEVLSILRSSDRKFLDVVCNDSIYSEGVPRITSLILMESLVHLSVEEGSPTILNALLKNNSLSLLIRSLKRADETITACGERNTKHETGVSINTLLYELAAFKSTLYVLIRIAHTRPGASQLVQNEIFSVIKGLKFLSVDADLGLDFYVEASEEYGDGDASLHLALDVPLALRGKKPNGAEHRETISFYEILVPSFQLIVTILLSMGPSYRPGILQVEELMKHFRPFVVSIMKRDTLVENKQSESVIYEAESVSRVGLDSLTSLVTLIATVLSGAPGDT